MIKLQITKYETNEKYDAEMAEYKGRSRYGNMQMDNLDYPRQEIAKNILEVFITEEQFNVIRKSVLEVF